MYIHPAFRIDEAASLAFAATRGFGLVVAHADGRMVASPLPFYIDQEAGGRWLAFGSGRPIRVGSGERTGEAGAKGSAAFVG